MPDLRARVRPSALDLVLRPLHRWVWLDAHRRARKLLRFAETEADGGRDLSRAAELTSDALLRRLYLRHAEDEFRHAGLFRARGRALLQELPRQETGIEANWLAPGERGLDDVRVEGEKDFALLAFLHLSEKAAAQRFSLYRQLLADDVQTREVFEKVLHDEAFHMSYTHTQLGRVAQGRTGLRLWQARLGRIWKTYLRLASALASVLGTVLLRLQYFLLLPPFAFLARRAARREPEGFAPARKPPPFTSQY
jgi:rubrerythrin